MRPCAVCESSMIDDAASLVPSCKHRESRRLRRDPVRRRATVGEPASGRAAWLAGAAGRCAEAEPLMIGERAAVLHHEDTGGLEDLCSLVVLDPELEPH